MNAVKSFYKGADYSSVNNSKIYYVGFNGYQQCPIKDHRDLPKVIEEWIAFTWEEIINICCTHRFVVIETKEAFLLWGMISRDKSGPLTIQKPAIKIDSFCSGHEHLIAGESTTLWKFDYTGSNWAKVNLNHERDEKTIWNENGNKIMKISYRMDSKNFIILLSNGSVWELTGNDHLKLLFPHDIDKAVDVASGLEHTLILTESGCVLSFGNGSSRGQLGTGNLESVQQPVQLESLEGLKIYKISAGYWHSCAITDSGDLCTWGWNNYGQLAAFEDGEEIGLTSLPVFVDVGEDGEKSVVDVACGSRHTIAKLENGNLYATGWNTYGQLGIQPFPIREKVSVFTKSIIKENQKRKLVTGPWYTILLENESEST